MSTENHSSISYIDVDYTVCGRIETMGESEITMDDELPLTVTVTDGFSSPNEQTGEYFTISLMDIELPWVLDEPFPAQEKKKGFFRRLFNK